MPPLRLLKLSDCTKNLSQLDLISIFSLRLPGAKQFNYKGHNYFYSGEVPALANKRVDWLEARNLCREYCMDAISIETQEENNLIFKLIQEKDVPYIWTSGRLCDFNGKKMIKKTRFSETRSKN